VEQKDLPGGEAHAGKVATESAVGVAIESAFEQRMKMFWAQVDFEGVATV
jgi:hypothetical protein